MTTDKVREARLRRMAIHQGLELRRSRVRDAHAPTFGQYQLTKTSQLGLTRPACGWTDLDGIEQELTS
jgi:hypothetical protein